MIIKIKTLEINEYEFEYPESEITDIDFELKLDRLFDMGKVHDDAFKKNVIIRNVHFKEQTCRTLIITSDYRITK